MILRLGVGVDQGQLIAVTQTETNPDHVVASRPSSLRNSFSAIFLNLLSLDRRAKRAIVIGTDIAICVVAVFVAMSLRVGALSFPFGPPAIFCAVAVPLFLAVFWLRGVYRVIFRFSGGNTILHLAQAVAIYAIPIVGIFMIGHVAGVPRTVAILQPVFFFLGISVARLVGRYIFIDFLSAHGFTGGVKRVMIYGAGGAGQQLALSLRHDPGLMLIIYTDDDERLDGQRLDGVEIVHSGKLDWAIERFAIDTILLAVPNASQSRRAEIVQNLQKYGIHVKTLPNMQQLVDGTVSASDLREIQLEDLLGREPVPPNELLLSKSIFGKTVLVTGAGGSIGSELARQILRLRPERLVLAEMTEHALYQIEADLREAMAGLSGASIDIVPELVNLVDVGATDRLFARIRPHTVFHAAAYKHVPLVEANRLSGLKNNILGTWNAAHAARREGVERFVLISTDKAVRPTNVMGASKRICELVLQALAQEAGSTRFAMVRFGNVLGSSGSVVPRFERQIREGGPVTLTHRDVTRYFMTIPEAAQLVIQAGAMADGGEVYLLDMGEPVKIIDLARTMIRLCGRSVRDENNPTGEIEIEEVGLRPGEKLYEELLIDSESAPTTNPRINRATERALDFDTLSKSLEELTHVLEQGDVEGAMAVMRYLVPEYSTPEQQNAAGSAGL